MTDKLLPCPFCGGNAEFHDTSSTWVRCEDCGAEIECQIEKKDAALAWNRRAPTAPTSLAGHPDDLAVDRFAAAMKAKLAQKRDEGRGGWDDPEQCTLAYLGRLLVEHIDKGDPVDICNFAMMIHQRATMEADRG